MKKIILLLLLSCVATQLHAQCESFAKELWSTVQNKNYQNFEKFVLPADQQRKIMHWPKSEKATKMLSELQAAMKSRLTISAKKLRSALVAQGFDIKNTTYKQCEYKEKNILTITLSDAKKEYSFFVETITTDAIYIIYPINETHTKLPNFNTIDEDNSNSTIHIDGKVFKTLEATEAQKKKAFEILVRKCLKGKPTEGQKFLLAEAMTNEQDEALLIYILAREKDPKRYTINLEKKSCVEGW